MMTSASKSHTRKTPTKARYASLRNPQLLTNLMFDDLAAYYHDNVVTEFADYRDTSKDGVAGRSRDLRRGLVAATALFHLREHLPGTAIPSRRDVEQQCPDYALLGDVVNAAKHKSITQHTPHGAPLVNHAASLEERQLLIEYGDSAGPYRHGLKTVVIKLSDGSERYLLEVMTNVINYWESRLHAIGVLASTRVFSYENPSRFRSRSECNNGRLDLEIVPGQRLRLMAQILRYNDATGMAEPVDLTGATARGSIYTPLHEVDVTLTHEAPGKEYKTTVALTKEESVGLHALSTDAEREPFAIGTQSAQAALRKLALTAGFQASSQSA